MFLERFTPAQIEREKGKRVSEYAERLHDMDANQLYAEFYNAIDSHPTLRAESRELRKDYANMAHAHRDQIRKQSGKPYEVHPAIVTLMTIKALEEKGIPVPADAVKAGLKHDMVEDGKDKGITLDTISEQSGHSVAHMVDVLTRHEENGRTIDHAKAAKKVRDADQRGVEWVKIIKTNDRAANIHDQPAVHRPPVKEHILFTTREYRKSPWGKWLRTKIRTKFVFSPIIADGDPFLEGILEHSMETTTKKIKQRPRKSITNR
jgi:(p)ppGpp synthase/HD superfamily hydrolase